MGQRTPFGTYTNEPSVNTAELSAAKKLSLYGTTEPRYCCTRDRKSTRLNSSHLGSSYAVFCLKKKTQHSTAACQPLATRGLRHSAPRGRPADSLHGRPFSVAPREGGKRNESVPTRPWPQPLTE